MTWFSQSRFAIAFLSAYYQRGGQYVAVLAGLLLLAGCYTTPQKATEVPQAQATAAYWLHEPAVVAVGGDEFEPLWDAAKRAAWALHFELSLQDPRQGVLTTEPLVAGQLGEPWRTENRSLEMLARANLAAYRRTIHFQFRPTAGGYVVTPKVVLERESLRERRLTTPLLYRSAFGRRRERGSREQDLGLQRPDRYWYAVGRDEALEKTLAGMIERRKDD